MNTKNNIESELIIRSTAELDEEVKKELSIHGSGTILQGVKSLPIHPHTILGVPYEDLE